MDNQDYSQGVSCACCQQNIYQYYWVEADSEIDSLSGWRDFSPEWCDCVLCKECFDHFLQETE